MPQRAGSKAFPLMHAPKVAIATHDYGKYSETFVRRHVNHLFSGRTVVVVSSPPTGDRPDRPLHVYAGPGSGRRGLRRLIIPYAARTRTPGLGRKDRALLRFFDRNGVSHLLCEFGYVADALADTIRAASIPVFCYFRGYDATGWLTEADNIATLRRIFPYLSGIVAVSQFLLDRLDEVGLRHPNARVIPSGTDIALFRPGPTDPNHVVTIGRLIPKKDPFSALSAFATAAAKHPELRWTIVGAGPLQAPIRERIDRLGLTDRITLMGIVPHHQVADLMCTAGVYLQAFRMAPDGDCEGMPSAIQEAMAAGRAIVTTRHAGIPEHIRDGQNGLLYDEGDADGLARGLDTVLTSADLRKRLGMAARAHAESALDNRVLIERLERFLSAAGPRP
jgi:glycosyltransferase involved in cell wall biosynthesis